ncbi:hypothetical protein JOM56_005633 [Amanita muscaria]
MFDARSESICGDIMHQRDDSHPSDPQLDTREVDLPLDQSLRIVANVYTGTFLLLSVSDDPIAFGRGSIYNDFSAYSNVRIYSEYIAFTGDLLSPRGISFSCNDITIAGPVKINTTGAPGDDQVIGQSGATDGDNGGLINFYVQSGSDDVSKHLSFVANGGKGGDAVVKNDQAGDGGNGGHCVRIFQSRYSALLGSVYEFLNRKDASKDSFASPVRKADPIYLSAFRTLTTALKSMVTEEKVKEHIQALRELLSGIAEGTPCEVQDLVINVRFVRNSLEDLADDQEGDFGAAASYKGGYGGSGKGVPAITGKEGVYGSDAPLFLSSYKPDISTTFVFAHPEQCAMLLDRAKIFYYMGSPELRLQAEILFQRLVHRLSFLPTDPLSQVNTESSIMSSNDLSELKSLKTEAANWLIQLATGVGFNGHPANWTPRASYTFYKGMLDTALDDHAAFENAYIQYHKALSEQQKLTESIALALQQMSQLISSLKKDIDDLFERLHETEANISSLTEAVKVTHGVLMDTFEILKDKIKNTFELSVPQIVNALRSLAFSPTNGMAGLEGFNLLYEGYYSIPDVEGRPVNKNLIIGSIEHGEATVKNIKDTLGKKLDGSFDLDDPYGTRLMTAEEDMMSFLEAYATSSFADVIDEIKEKFDEFVKATITRNEQVVLYNMQLKLGVSKIANKNDYEKKAKDLKGREIEAHDPDLQNITVYMGNIYQSSRARVMALLDNLVRSLNYRMLLTNYDIFRLAFEGEPNEVPLTITHNALRSGRSRIEYEFGRVVEIWGSEPAHFPNHFDDPMGKRIYLSKSELTSLIMNHRVVMKIPPMYKDTIKKNDFSGCCNVRIYRVRFGLTGLAPKKSNKMPRVTVIFKHSGGEIIVDRENLEHKFIHEPIAAIYSFHLNPDGTIVVQDNGNIGEADVDKPETNYAAPGPFADDWEVDLKSSDLIHLDFSKVTEAYFDFCGTNYPFP